MNIIVTALDLLRNEGWVKKHSEIPQGRCMSGALQRAGVNLRNAYDIDRVTFIDLMQRSDRIVQDTIAEQFPDRINPIPYFNDLTVTTWEDVERVMEKAAVKYDELYG